MSYPINWDLDSIFKGGSDSKEFTEFLHETDSQINKWIERKSDVTIVELVHAIEGISPRLRQTAPLFLAYLRRM